MPYSETTFLEPAPFFSSAERAWNKSATWNPEQVLEYLGSVSNAKNQELFAEIKKRLIKNAHEEISLIVTSSGGPTGAAMSFYETMRKILRPKLVTIGIGDVDSSGIIIFLSGKRRLISERTTLLLHLSGRRFDPDARFTVPEMEAMIAEDTLKDRQYAGVIAENSSILTAQDVFLMMKHNTVLSPDDLIKFELAHSII